MPVFDREFLSLPILSLVSVGVGDANCGIEQRSLLRQEHLQGPFGNYTVKKVLDLMFKGVVNERGFWLHVL